MVGIVAEILRKNDMRDYTCYVLTTDVWTAFDEMKHGELQNANEYMGVSTEAQLASLMDCRNKTADMEISGVGKSEQFGLQKGGGQGGVRTPDEFNNMMQYALGTVGTWQLGLVGFHFTDGWSRDQSGAKPPPVGG